MTQEFCGNAYEMIIGEEKHTAYCERAAGHTGWHHASDGGFRWQRKEDKARDMRRRKAKEEAVEFVRALSEDPRSLPWCVTAREIMARIDQ